MTVTHTHQHIPQDITLYPTILLPAPLGYVSVTRRGGTLTKGKLVDLLRYMVCTGVSRRGAQEGLVCRDIRRRRSISPDLLRTKRSMR